MWKNAKNFFHCVEKYGLFFHSVETFFPLCGPAAAGSIVWKTPIGFAGLPAPGCNPAVFLWAILECGDKVPGAAAPLWLFW